MKYSYRTRIALLSLLLISNFIYSQELPTIAPLSPNAASLSHFVEVPVSHYTGLPNINIPLYSISSKAVNIPVSLSYHARGVKLAELASSCGLGWSLNAGGVVTRQIRGNADDSANGYLNQDYYEDIFTNPTTRDNAYSAEINGLFDRMPDQFIFNFLGFSGKFIYDRNTNTTLLKSFDDLKIETIGNPSQNIEGFIITDTNGTKYYFGKSTLGTTATEENHTLASYTYTQSGTSVDYTASSSKSNAWYLLEIIPLTGNKITFTYELEDSKTYRKTEEVAEKIGSSFEKTSYFSEVRLSQQKIKKIEFDNGEITFNYNTTRDDLNPYVVGILPKALTSVEVTNSTGQSVKKYVFDYVYTTSTSSSNIIPHLNTNAPEAKKRLFLNSVKEEGENGTFLPPYLFTYNSQVLPSRFSSSHDKWGFFNGQNNGYFSVFSEDTSEILGTVIDPVKAKAGLLTKIEYPTGGSSEYIYESNKAVFPEHLNGHIAFTQNNPVETQYVVLDKDPVFYDYQDKEYSFPFTVSTNMVATHPNGTGTLHTTIFLADPECTNVESYDCDYFIRINRADDTTYGILHNGTTSIQIVPGDYILKVIPTDPGAEDPDDGGDDFGIQLAWDESVESELDIIYTGGNRIKKTILEDGKGNTIEKNYEYTYPNGETSGKVFALPSYYGYGTITTSGGTELKVYHHVMYRPADKLTLEQGNHGGYAYVTEYVGDSTSNIGKNEYEFTTYYDAGLYYEQPYHLPNDNEWLRGKPTKILSYRNNNGTYELVKEINHAYQFIYLGGSPRTYKEVPLIVFNNILNLNSGTFDPSTAHNFYTVFNLHQGVIKLESTEEINHFENGSNITYTDYFYNYEDHYQIKKVDKTASDGRKISNLYTYAHDKPSALTTAEQKLFNQNRLDVIEESTFQNSNEYLKTIFTEFDQWHGNNELVLPKLVKVAKGTQSLENRIVYNDYYSNGNVMEVSKSDGPSIFYIWGYNDQYPIAKLENFSDSDITTTIQNNIDAAVSASNSDIDAATEDALRTALTTLRNSVSNTMMTSYTYDPLIGVTSITDPKENVTFYEYDEFNRLKRVWDAEGNILSENDYHYKGQ